MSLILRSGIGIIYDEIIQKPDLPPLLRAAADGDTVSLQSLLKDKADVNQIFEIKVYAYGDINTTALHVAVYKDRLETTEILLQCGASVNKCDSRGCTPLHLTKSSEVAKMLLDKGADVRARDYNQRTPLHRTESPEVAKLLLDNGAYVSARDNNHKTPMQHAVIYGHFKALPVMLTHVASPTHTWVQKALATAQVTEDEEVKKSILSYCADILSDPTLNFQDDAVLEWSSSGITDTVLQEKLQHLPEDGKYLALFLNQNNITTLPNLKQLKSLLYLNVCNNPLHTVKGFPTRLKNLYFKNTKVQVLTKECFNQNTFTVVKQALEDARLYYNLKQPPKEVFDRGLDNIINYFSQGHLLSNCRYSFVNVGETGAGKTSLVKSIIKSRPYLTKIVDRTQVMDLQTWNISDKDIINILDQGGHKIYDVVTPYFIARKSILSIAHDISDESHHTLDRTHEVFRKSLHQCPDNQILFSLTHSDKLTDKILREREEIFQRKILQIINGEIDTCERLLQSQEEKNYTDLEQVEYLLHAYRSKKTTVRFFTVSSKTYNGIEELKEYLTSKIAEQRVVIPMVWIDLYDTMKEDMDRNYWKIQDLKEQLAQDIDEQSFSNCLTYFKDTGLIFWQDDNPILKQYIFHKPQFLIDLFKAIFHHDLENDLNYTQNKELQLVFDEVEFDDVMQMFQNEGILKRKLLTFQLKKFRMPVSDHTAVISLIKEYHIFHEVFSEPDDIEETLYFVPWFTKENKAPEDLDLNHPIVMNKNEVTINVERTFHNQVPINVCEMLCVELQKYAVQNHYNGSRYAWKDGLKVQIGPMKLYTFKNIYTSSVWICARGPHTKLPDMWIYLDDLNESVRSILIQWIGTMRSSHSNCTDCVGKGELKPYKWPLKNVLPRIAFNSKYSNCRKNKASIPAALVTKLPKESKEEIQSRIQDVAEHMEEYHYDAKQHERSIQIARPQDQPDVTDLSRQLNKMDSNISAQLAQHQTRSSFENWVLSEQIFRQNQQLSLQGQAHAQQNLAQNQVLSEQMNQQWLQLSGENQVLSQQMNQQRLQLSGENQMLSQQMNQQRLQLSGENQVLSQQMNQQRLQLSGENQVLSEQMYLQDQELYLQGQTHAQQSHDQSIQLATQVAETRQQLSHQTQAQGRELVGQLEQTSQQLADVMRLEAGDASGITLNIQHPVLKEHQQVLEQHLQVDSELLNNMLFNDLISMEEKPRIEQDANSSSRICRVLKLLEQNDNDKIKKFIAALCMCKRDGANYLLGEMIRKDFH